VTETIIIAIASNVRVAAKRSIINGSHPFRRITRYMRAEQNVMGHRQASEATKPPGSPIR
jgi:hypothetical protein